MRQFVDTSGWTRWYLFIEFFQCQFNWLWSGPPSAGGIQNAFQLKFVMQFSLAMDDKICLKKARSVSLICAFLNLNSESLWWTMKNHLGHLQKFLSKHIVDPIFLRKHADLVKAENIGFWRGETPGETYRNTRRKPQLLWRESGYGVGIPASGWTSKRKYC